MIAEGVQIARLEKWTDKYQISFQFWGKGNNNVFIEKDDVELFSTGGKETILEVLSEAVDWIHRVNNVKEEINPNF